MPGLQLDDDVRHWLSLVLLTCGSVDDLVDVDLIRLAESEGDRACEGVGGDRGLLIEGPYTSCRLRIGHTVHSGRRWRSDPRAGHTRQEARPTPLGRHDLTVWWRDVLGTLDHQHRPWKSARVERWAAAGVGEVPIPPQPLLDDLGG